MTKRQLQSALLATLVVAASAGGPATAAAPTPPGGPRLSLEAVDEAPAEGRRAPAADELAKLRERVASEPGDRAARFDLVQGLIASGELPAALEAAQSWRARDAYNLVVVRLIGDIRAALGQHEEARRAYSAVVELLPDDPSAHRALATVLKQSGDLPGAYDRLVAAVALRPDDVRLAFELADAAHRLGRNDEATTRFEGIAGTDGAPESVRYPARQRLLQLYTGARRAALTAGDDAAADALAARIGALGVKGGADNDIKIYLSWDTDRSDVDLWVLTPSGEKVFYEHKQGRGGEALFDDVTTGYGPESFTAHRAQPGAYVVQINYFDTDRRRFTEARGELVVVLHEGTARESRQVLPYRLFRKGQTVTVARIHVGRDGGES